MTSILCTPAHFQPMTNPAFREAPVGTACHRPLGESILMSMLCTDAHLQPTTKWSASSYGEGRTALREGPESSPGSDEIIGYRGVQDTARAEKGKTDRRTEHNRARFESWRRTCSTSDRNGIRFS